MPVFIAYVAAAIGTYFGGSVVVAEVAYAVISVAVYVAANIAISKITQLLAGKLSPQQNATPPSRMVTDRGTVQFQQLIYGQVRTAGFLAFFGTSGANNNQLWFVIALAGHQCEAIDDVWMDSRHILDSDISGTGQVTAAAFNVSGTPYLSVWKHLGTATDPVDPALAAAFPEWDSSHVGYGIPYMVFNLARNDTVYPGGAPASFFALVKGRRLYDPRLDSTNGGSGSHRFTDPSTWAWSRNWALAVRDYIAGGAVVYTSATPDKRKALGENDSRVDDAFIIAAANSSDEAVTVPLPTLPGTLNWSTGLLIVTGNGTQFTSYLSPGSTLIGPDGLVYTVAASPAITDAAFPLTAGYAGSSTVNSITHYGTGGATSTTELRFTADTQLSTGNTHGENLGVLLSAGNGHLAYVGGKYRIFAGVYTAPTVTLTQDDIVGAIDVLTHDPADQVWNYVDGTFFDENNGWTEGNFPAQQAPSYEADDGRQYPRSIDLQATRGNYRAQRLAQVVLQQGRNMLTISASALSQKALQIAEWDTFLLNVPEYGWSGQIFRCVQWSFLASGYVSIAARSEGSAAYADLPPGSYVDPSTNNPPAFVLSPPDAPVSLVTQSLDGEVALFAGFPRYFPATSFFEFWEYTSSAPFSSATLIGRSPSYRLDVAHNDATVRYYWVTVGDANGGRSGSYPSGAGVSGFALQSVYAISNITGAAVWIHLGTLVLNESNSANFEWATGVGFNSNLNQQTIAGLQIRSSNNTAAPNLSGINVINTGATAPILAAKAKATGGSTSPSNVSWEIYLEINAFTGGPIEVVVNSAGGDSFVFDGSVSTDPGAASTTIVVGNIAQGLNAAAGSGLDALPDGTTFARFLAAGLASGIATTAGLVSNAASQIISATSTSFSQSLQVASPFVDMLTCSGTFSGAPVGIDFSGTVTIEEHLATINSPLQICITRDGTAIGTAIIDMYAYVSNTTPSGSGTIFWIMPISLIVNDTPAAGAHTYAAHLVAVTSSSVGGATSSVSSTGLALKVREYKR